MFPIDILPPSVATVMRYIPLEYLAYFPAAVFLGKIQGAELAVGLCVQLAWVLFFMLASRVTFHFGVKRYSAFGG
jgi:ABC-2 type transport system permease protein